MNDGVMIAYLPTTTSWCRQPLPHMTLVYCGTIDQLSPTAYNRLSKDALTAARVTGSFTLDVEGIDVFGDEPEKVDVLRLSSTPALQLARKLVEDWNASDKPFNPHATVGPEGSASNNNSIPMRLSFNRIMVGWGDQQMVFNLDW